MKRWKFTEEQIAFALHQADTGVPVEEVCRKVGISQATFYAWKKKFGGMGVSELRRLRQLEEENRKLKQLVADLSLDKVMLQDVLRTKLWGRRSANSSSATSSISTESVFRGPARYVCKAVRVGIKNSEVSR
jgi:putative transposase